MHRFVVAKMAPGPAGRIVLSHAGRAQIVVEDLCGFALMGEEDPDLLGACYMLVPCVRRYGRDIALILGRLFTKEHHERMLAGILPKEAEMAIKNQIDGATVEYRIEEAAHA